MDFWNSYIQLLAQLQLFTRIGSFFWSLPAIPLLIWFFFTEMISFSTGYAARVFTTTIWIGLFVLIPFCICSLREYVALAVSEKQGQVTISKPPQALAPPKLIWLSTAISLAEVVIQIVMAVKHFDLQVGLLSITLVSFLMLYRVMFGILFGTMT